MRMVSGNLHGLRRAPDKQIEPGFVVTGPVIRQKLWFSTSYEYFQNRGLADARVFTFPAAGFSGFTVPGSNLKRCCSSIRAHSNREWADGTTDVGAASGNRSSSRDSEI